MSRKKPDPILGAAPANDADQSTPASGQAESQGPAPDDFRCAPASERLNPPPHLKPAPQGLFLRFSSKVADTSGRPISFMVALVLIIAWASSGPAFGFSETWQMVVNTGTTIVTFLMVFLLQNAQNRDSRALQAKLDELILTSQADNRFVGVENLDAEELRRVSIQLVEKAGTRIDETPLERNPRQD